MREIIRNTSPLQYLNQLGLLDILPRLANPVVVPPAVVDELQEGLTRGMNLPDVSRLEWITMHEFQHLLASRQIPVHYDVSDFEEDLRTLRDMAAR